MPRFETGQTVPDFTLPAVVANPNHQEATSQTVQTQVCLNQLLADSKKGVVVYFYPRASTPGCTTEACDFRDSLSSLQAHGYQVLGVSPDQPAALAKFIEKQALTFPLASDPEHETMEAWGAWGEKKNYGRIITSTIRSTLVINKNREVIWAGYNIRAKGHVARLRKELGIDVA